MTATGQRNVQHWGETEPLQHLPRRLQPSGLRTLRRGPWVSYQPLATVAHAFPVMVLPLGEKRAQLKVTPDDLRRNLRARPHAKLFVLNSPVNPTGQLYSAAELEALLQVCVEHEIYFVSELVASILEVINPPT